MDPKKMWESRMIWVNVVAFLIAILGAAVGTDLVKDHPEVVAYIAAAQSLLNVVLRLLTNRPVEL